MPSRSLNVHVSLTIFVLTRENANILYYILNLFKFLLYQFFYFEFGCLPCLPRLHSRSGIQLDRGKNVQIFNYKGKEMKTVQEDRRIKIKRPEEKERETGKEKDIWRERERE